MGKIFQIPQFDFKGIKRITIPKLDSDFTESNGYGWDIIKKYLPSILSTHKKNAKKITYLYDYFLGEQDICAKQRKLEIHNDNNNIETENHANRQVECKVGLLCAEQRDYTHKSDTESDDLIYLDRQLADCKFFSKDVELKEWIYSTGIGVTKTRPRTDIIITEKIDTLTNRSKTRYLTKEEGFDVKYEASIEFDCIDPRNNFVVYSSHTNKKPLFCVEFVDIDISKETDSQPLLAKQILVETRYAWFKFTADNAFKIFYWNNLNEVEIVPKSLRYLPLLEFSVNKDRIGVVEKNRSAFNTVNLFRSVVNDMMVENANSLLVFKNVDIDQKTISDMIKAGAVVIKDGQNGATTAIAGLTTVTIEIPYDKMATYVDQVIQNAYDIVGVPIASGQVTSGGDTGVARGMGNGWENAYVIIDKEKEYLLGIDYEQLKLILMLSKQVPNSPLENLYASEVDINYHITKRDNLLVRVEAMKLMWDMHCPEEFILKVTGVSSDVKGDAKAWKENVEMYRAIQAEMEKAKQTSTEQIKVEETEQSNNSQE